RPGRHPQAGTVYYWALAVVFVTMSALAFSRWSDDYHLFILGLLAFIAATIGRTARRKLWPSWPRIHMTGMGVSYILMITAFYVYNGPNLPLWRELPPLAFWTLPTLIGAPILINALLRHPLEEAMSPRKIRYRRNIGTPGETDMKRWPRVDFAPGYIVGAEPLVLLENAWYLNSIGS